MPKGKKFDLNEQLNKIFKEYTDDIISTTFAIVDTYADFCKEHVKQDSPVADEVIIRRKHDDTNALVESALGNKQKKAVKREFKPGYYRGGWAVRLDRDALRQNQMMYVKVVYNRRQPYLTHLLENGHDLKDSSGNTIGHVKKIPHIVQNGEVWSKACYDKIDDYLKKGRKLKW